MTRDEAGEAIGKILKACMGTPTVVVAIIGEEHSDDVKVLHPLHGGDRACARLLRATADEMDPNGVLDDILGEDPSDEEAN